MNLIEAEELVQDTGKRRRRMYDLIDDFIRKNEYKDEEYRKAVYEMENIWPLYVTPTWIEQLQHMVPRRLPFGGGFYSLYTYRFTSDIGNERFWNEFREKFGDFIVDFSDYSVDLFGRRIDSNVYNLVIFMRDEEQVREFYHKIIKVSIFCYHIMEQYYVHFDELSQQNLNFFAKDPIGRNRMNQYYRIVDDDGSDIQTYKLPESEMCSLIKNCFLEFEGYFLKERDWNKEYNNKREHLVIDLRGNTESE